MTAFTFPTTLNEAPTEAGNAVHYKSAGVVPRLLLLDPVLILVQTMKYLCVVNNVAALCIVYFFQKSYPNVEEYHVFGILKCVLAVIIIPPSKSPIGSDASPLSAMTVVLISDSRLRQ